MPDERDQSVAWRPGETPVPIQVAMVHSDPDRIRDLEEQSRDHHARLNDHDVVLKDIRSHLEDLVTQFHKLRTLGLIAVVVIFGGTTNGTRLAELLAGLFH